jgi:predicted RNA methylase
VAEDRLWDLRLGVSTRSVVSLADMDLSGPNADRAATPMMRGRRVVYVTPRIGDLRHALRSVPGEAPLHLVDFGSGKGRALIAARMLGYETATGVELSERLCRVAEANLSHIRRRHPELADGIAVVNADATEFEIRPQHNVFYFYNPFGSGVLRPVLDSIVASVATSPREAWVVYVNHVHRSVFTSHPMIEVAADLTTQNYSSTLYRVRAEPGPG